MNKLNDDQNLETREMENFIVEEHVNEDKNHELEKSNTDKIPIGNDEKIKNQVNGHIVLVYALLTITMVFGFLPAFDFILSSIFIVQPNKQMFYTFIQFAIIGFGLLKALNSGLLEKDKSVIEGFNKFSSLKKGSITDYSFILVSVSLYFYLLNIGFFEIDSIISKMIETIF